MAELNLNQIIDRLNAEFIGDTRKLVFWYDDKGDFAEDMDAVALENAEVFRLEEGTQFQTKYFLERQDRTTNYLVYAPFPKPDVGKNHLEDTLLYSKRFYADRASLLLVDLGIEERCKLIIEKHIKFFGGKDRIQRFYDLEIEHFNEHTILVGLMSVVCRTRTCSFDEVIRVLLTDDALENSKFLVEFAKYDLLPVFWLFCERQFGYSDSKPTLEKLLVTLFVTYADKSIDQALPKGWQPFVSGKSGNIVAFLDSLMNNYLYRERYDQLSDQVAEELGVSSALASYESESLLGCDSFREIDQIILRWLVGRLLAEDTGATLVGYGIPAICEMRQRMHFGGQFASDYGLLSGAYGLIVGVKETCPDGFGAIISRYQSTDYQMDTWYRHFYTCYDQLEDSGDFEPLRDLVEAIYTNDYLGKQLPKWNMGLMEPEALSLVPLQRNFYAHYVQKSKERTVVIISDALRYEVGYALFQRMQDDPKCSASLSVMLGTLPSYTRLGMAALLPHTTLELTDEGKELVDGLYCPDLASRQSVLQAKVPNSCCVQFDEIKNMKKAALREVFTGKQVVYVYHDQIDVRGEHTEDEVFVACAEAITEIADLIRRISINANTLHFIVTADHGFIYKRDKVKESDKIGGLSDKSTLMKRRYMVSNQMIQEDGVCNLGLGYLLGNRDQKVVSFPCSTSVFKIPGSGGQNYVHGGSSPQEMLLPVLDLKMEKGHMETKTVQIMLVSLVQKITNLITTLDFIQSEPLSDVVRGTTFRLYFISGAGEKISNEAIHVADSRALETQKRLFRLRFTFKDRKYDKSQPYYLVAYDEARDMEVLRHSVIMDLAFAGDFGFGV